MPVYKYKALTEAGVNIEGTYTAASKNEVISMLRQKQSYPLLVIEDHSKDVKELRFFKKVGLKDLAIFCRQFYAMLNAGVNILNCLQILAQQVENKHLRTVLAGVHEDVQKGLTFSEALKKHRNIFPELLVHMVEAGEESGTLDIIMERMAVHYEKEVKINNKIKGALIYPMILTVVSLLVVIFLLTFVMPTFLSMFESSGVALPLPTVIMLAISASLQKYWYILGLAGIGLILGFRRYSATPQGRYNLDRLLFRLPVIKGTVQKVIAARFTRTLATLLTSGIPLLQALENVANVVGNKVFSEAIMATRDEVRKGVPLAEPIQKTGLFPPMVDNMIRIGEESGTLDDLLDKTANFYDEEVEIAFQKMTTMLEPILIVVMAVVVGFIVISMVLPMFDMMQTI